MISLKPSEPKISLKGTSLGEPILDEVTQQENALKYHYVLGENSPGYDQLLQSAKLGLDASVKDRIATLESLKNQDIRHSLMSEVAKHTQGQKLSPATYQFVQGLAGEQLRDPDYLYSKAFAEKLLGTPYEKLDFEQAFKTPEEVEEYNAAADGAADVIAFRENVHQKLKKLEAKHTQRNVLSRTATHLERWIPFASYFNQRSTVPGSGSLWLGENKLEQYRALNAMPLEQRIQAFNQAVDEVAKDNVVDAIDFAQGYLQFSTIDKRWSNLSPALDIIDVAPFGLIGKGISKATGAAAKAGNVTKIPKSADKGLDIRNGLEVKVMKGEKNVTTLKKTSAQPEIISYPKKTTEAIVKASNPENPNIVSDVLAASGRGNEAAVIKAVKLQTIKSNDPPTTKAQADQVDSFVPSMYDPKEAAKSVIEGPNITKLTNRSAQYVNDVLMKVERGLGEAIDMSASIVSRFATPDGLKHGWRLAQEEFDKLYPAVSDAVLDVRFRDADASFANAPFIETVFGRLDKTLFPNEVSASYAAQKLYHLLPNGYTVEQNGSGYQIAVKTFVDETKTPGRFLIDTTDPTPQSFWNTWTGYFRTSNDVLKNLDNEERKRITHTYSLIQSKVKDASGVITKVHRNPLRGKRFDAVLYESMHHKVPRQIQFRNRLTGQVETKTTEDVGLNYSQVEFELKYQQSHGQNPSPLEIAAYETYKKLLDFDYIIRNFDLTRDKLRLGMQEWMFFVKAVVDEAGTIDQRNTMFFDGKLLDDLPYNSPTETIVAVYDDADGFAHVDNTRQLAHAWRDRIKQMVSEEGYRIIQIANPDMKPLRSVLDSEEAVNFVVVKGPQTRPLGLQQIPKKEGGHRIPKWTMYLKAPRVLKPVRKRKDKEGKVTSEELDQHFYDGDISLYGIHSEVKGREMLPHLHKARDLFIEGKKREFFQYVSKYIPRDPERFWKDFEDKVIPTNTDYYLVQTGQGVNDTTEFKSVVQDRFPNFVDAVDSEFNLYRRINKKFAGQKNPDLFSWENVDNGENNPVIKMTSAKYIDPVPAMQESLSSLMRNRVFADHIHRSTESWVEEFKGLMKTPPEVLRANPLHFVHNPEWVDKPTNRAMFAAAQNSRRALIQLLGTKSDLRNNVDWAKNKIIDSVYKHLGDKPSEFLSDAMLPTTNDPLAYVRGAAFHLKLGLLNPVQIWTQSQTMFHMTAITGNPIRAGQSFVGAAWFQMLRNTTNPKIIDHVATLASRSGFGSKADFIESYEALRKTGLWFVEGEHGWRNDTLDPQMFQGLIGRTLDKAAVFFKETERFVRLASWQIAYKEFKKANPGRGINENDLKKILARQDNLSVNMTTASASALQRGVFSPATQFLGYQMRIMDQVLGKRLTKAERARVIAMYSAVYGVPIGGSAGVLAPWYGDIKTSAEQAGISVDEGAWQGFFNGALSYLTEAATGDEYNPAKRYGPGGFEILKTLIDDPSAASALEFVGGASYTVLSDAVRWAYPAITSLWSQVWMDETDAVPLETSDFVDAFRSVSTVNNATKAYMAYYYQSYFTRDGSKITDMSEVDAFMTAVFGLTPQRVERMYQQLDQLKDRRSAHDSLKAAYLKTKRQILRTDDALERDRLTRRARILLKSGDLTTEEAGQWFRQGLQGQSDLVKKIDDEYREKFMKKIEGQ